MVLKKVSLITIAFFCMAIVQGQSFIVGSFNLRYDNPRDSGNLWVNRAPIVASLIRFHDFDVLGTQEGLRNQLDDIKKTLPEYAFFGAGREDGQAKGEHSAIFYKTATFNLLKSGNFWLSPTPEKPGPGWDARLNRICSWVQLQDKRSKKKFYFFNVHYDHQGVEARRESSLLMLKKIKEIAGNDPVVFTGDLNGSHESEWYKSLEGSGWLKDTYKQVAHPYANNGSFNSFGASLQKTEIIDHIFVTAPFKAQKWGVLSDHYHGKFPSDHYPILTVISL